MQSSFLAPILHMDRSLLVRSVEDTSQSAQAARQSTPESSSTLISPPTEIPDSVERYASQRNEIDIETPPPIKKKVIFLDYHTNIR